MAATIALVDDDRNILTSVSIALEAEGFTVRTYSDPEEALRQLTAHPVDLAVLDIKMPKLNGFELLQKLRRATALPVIFLTSKDGEEDEMLGLKLGADDYIKKPFSQGLLIERIRAILRRELLLRSTPNPVAGSVLQLGPLRMDEARHACSWNNQHLTLTVTEFMLLLALVREPGLVRTREHLITVAYGDQPGTDDRTIDSHIKRLRKKFRDIDPNFDQIETLYGAGYRYRDQRE